MIGPGEVVFENDRRPVLRITDEGVYVKTLFGWARCLWSEISDIELHKDSKVFRIVLLDPRLLRQSYKVTVEPIPDLIDRCRRFPEFSDLFNEKKAA